MEINLLETTEEEREELAREIAEGYTEYSHSQGVKGNYEEKVERLVTGLFDMFLELKEKPCYRICGRDIIFLDIGGYADINGKNTLYMYFINKGLYRPPKKIGLKYDVYPALWLIKGERNIVTTRHVYEERLYSALLNPTKYHEAVTAMKPELSEYLRERRKELTRQKELVKQGHYDVEEQILREHVKKVYSGSTATSILYESDNIAIIGLSHQELFHNETSGRGYYTASRRVLDKIVCLYSTDGKEQICTYVLFVEEKDYGICFDKSCFGESSKTFLSEVNCLKLPELASFILRCCERGEGTCFEDVEPYLKRLVAFRAI